MRIECVIMRNFGSYEQVEIDLAEGTTAITGVNEAGKTTLLHAIGFALFDYRAGKLVGYLREGTAEGMVSVRAAFSEHGTYWVTRRFNAKTTLRYQVLDLGGTLIASGREAVREWLQERMGINPELGLNTLFERVIGVPQGADTAPYLLSPGPRAGIFGRLLQSQEYQKASDGLRPTEKALTEGIHVLETTIAKAEGELTILPTLTDERCTLTAVIANIEATLPDFQKNVSSAHDRVVRMNEILEKAKKARARADKSRVRADTHRPRVVEARQAVKDAEEAAEVVRENLPTYREYQLVAAKLKELEQAEEEYGKLLAKQGRLREQVARAEQAQVREGEVEVELKQLCGRETELEQGRMRRVELKAELAEYGSRIEDTQKLLNSCSNTATVAMAEYTRLREQSDRLLVWEDAYCPTCGTGLTPAGKDEILQRNTREAELTHLNGTEAQKRADDHAGMIKRLRERRQKVEDSMAAIPSADQLPRVRKKLADLTVTLSILKKMLEANVTDAADLERVTTVLDEKFGTLIVELRDFKSRRDTCEEGWLAYTRNQTSAQRLPEYLDKQRKVQDAQDQMERDALQILGEAQTAQAAYDEKEHDQATAEWQQLQENLTAARTQLKEKQGRAGLVDRQIASLQVVAENLDLTRLELEATNKDRSVVQYVRKVLREAGPLVTQRTVERVSQVAASNYRDLTGSSEGYLRWTQDFGLVLCTGKGERPFARFSGGQQMNAALALRLALLKETSGVGVVFLDEPTAHVSEDRREYLATKIGQIQGVQVLVISHDPTFERVTDQYVRIVRDEGGSHPV